MNSVGIFVKKSEHDILVKDPINNDSIYLIQQFFIHIDPNRQKEILYCLRTNIDLGVFDKIILLNEKIYSKEELGLNDIQMDKIEQINIEHRLTYKNVFENVNILNLNGYIVFSNSDIFFDKSILNVRRSCLSITKSIYTLLRFEFIHTKKRLGFCKLFVHPRTNKPRPDSQDTWIYHTSQFNNLSDKILNNIDFPLGKPGCDNKLTYELDKYGYNCINVPWNIKNYHYHSTSIRDYGIKDALPRPYLYIEPIL